jgi:biopolymer transport protein ExbB/TolQ
MAMFKSVDKIKFAVRAGPALGLMGTLIPMGIALASLAQGSVPQMAEEMVTAFTATVVGLGCGVVAYRFSLIKEHWANSDLREMEYLAEAALREAGTSGAASSSSGTTPSGKVFEGVD